MTFGGSPKKSKTSEKSTDVPALPDKLTPENVDSLIAGMSDEQVRRLLIEELKKEARHEAESAAPKGPTGLAGFIERTKEMVTFLRARIEFLRSGVNVDIPEQAPEIFTYLGTGEKGSNPSLPPLNGPQG